MERRYKIILIVAIIVVLIGILALLFRPSSEVRDLNNNTNQIGGGTPTGELSRSGAVVNGGSELPDITPPPAPPADIAVRQISMTFAERYGTFSSEGNFVNVTDIYPLVTQRYRQELEKFVARERAKPAAAFGATTTTVITTTAELTPKDAPTHAKARVSTQRTAEGGGTSKTYAQILVIELENSSAGWLVDQATWELPSQ